MEQLNLFDMIGDEEHKPIKSNDWKWTYKDYPTQNNGIKVFSCFACGGGSTMGYKLAGCDVLGCLEIDPKINAVYMKNHHPKYNFLMDIREFNKLDDLPEELYNLDILDGSPPCTTFSMAGEREESWGKQKKFREGQTKQTLDDLSFIFIETVKKLKPKVVIMENVEGITLGAAWQYVQRIYSDLTAAGYLLTHHLLRGEEMGIPQTRHRVFFIAIRKDLNIDPKSIDMSFNYLPITYGEIKAGEGTPLNPKTQAYFYIKNYATPEEKRLADVFKKIGEKERRFNYRIAWEENILQTLTASLDYICGRSLRSISIEDIIHAQTFPEDYEFIENTFQNVAYICGMSVPPLMIKRIVNKLINYGVFDYLKEG